VDEACKVRIGKHAVIPRANLKICKDIFDTVAKRHDLETLIWFVRICLQIVTSKLWCFSTTTDGGRSRHLSTRKDGFNVS
jgi:hypothetical protein